MIGVFTATPSCSGIYLSDGSAGEINLIGFGTDTAVPALVGSVNEFRIWNGGLQQSDITVHYTEGPDQNFGKLQSFNIEHI